MTNELDRAETWHCPKCGYQSLEYPGLIKADEKTKVCTECGVSAEIKEYMKTKIVGDKVVDYY